MAMLIGKYLVEVVTSEKLINGKTIHSAAWVIQESPSGRGDDWRVKKQGETDEPMDRAEDAYAAAKAIGEYEARRLQGDMNLLGKHWGVPFPEVSKY